MPNAHLMRRTKTKQELQRCFGQAASLISRLKQSQHVVQHTEPLQYGFGGMSAADTDLNFCKRASCVKNTAEHVVKSSCGEM